MVSTSSLTYIMIALLAQKVKGYDGVMWLNKAIFLPINPYVLSHALKSSRQKP
ncbi:MAG: hypothetical protein JWO00_144 [Candidatus Parcubacteria bacterium]|nr:hypothetical protein [Candidatus Parcubacteria bacterium]